MNLKAYNPFAEHPEPKRLRKTAYLGILVAIVLIVLTLFLAIHLDRRACEQAGGRFYRDLHGTWCRIDGVKHPGPSYLSDT